MTSEDKNLQHIKCPKCGWHGAVVNVKTGLITCQYCMYRSKKWLMNTSNNEQKKD